MTSFPRDRQFVKFCAYGFLKNQKFFEPFLILFFMDQGIDFLEIGTLVAIREIMVNLLEIPTGFAADIFGRRKGMILSLLSYIIAFVIFYLFGNFYIYIGAMFFFAIGEAFRTGTHKAMILEYLKIKNWTKYKAHYYGQTRAWSLTGSAVAALIGAGLIFFSGDYRIIFAASCIPYILNLFLMISYPSSLDGAAGENSRTLGESVKESFCGFFHSITNRNTAKALLNSSMYGGQFESVKQYLQPILQSLALGLPVLLYLDLEDTQKSAIITGAVYCILYLLSSLASRMAGDVKDRIDSPALILNITFASCGVITAIAGILTSYTLFYPAAFLFVAVYLLYNLRRPLSVAYISDCVDSRNMAAGLSVESQGKVLINAGLSLFAGFIADRYGVGTAVTSSGMILVLSSLFLNLMKTTCTESE